MYHGHPDARRAMKPDERPSKRDAFLAFLKEGWVSVHLDARRPGVNVPAAFNDNPHLVLQYGYDMKIPIPDLEVTDDGIRATLSFSRTPHPTTIPWSAIYIVACPDGRGILYFEDVPPEVSLQAAPTPGGAPHGETPPPEIVEPPVSSSERMLRAVPPDEQGDGTAAQSSRRTRRPTLRLVK